MPLSIAQKLKIKSGDIIWPINAPANFANELKPMPDGPSIDFAGSGFSQIHWFVKNRASVEKESETILPKVKGAIICWIFYPKGSSGIQTDLTRDKGWDSLLAHKNLQWLSLVSFNETWSAFGFREQTDADKRKEARPNERPIFDYIDAVNKTIKLPDDLQAALSSHQLAANFFETLSFTNKKEYVEWIVTAKQEKTRNQRLIETVKRLENNWRNPRNLS